MISNGQPIARQSSRITWLAMLQTGIAICGLAVALGAFGAHALDGFLNESSGLESEEIERLTDAWKTASDYQMYHGFAIILLAFTVRIASSNLAKAAFICFLVGILLFSGSLYWWVTHFEEDSFIVRFVPLGGLCFLLGWLLFFLSCFGLRAKQDGGSAT